MQGCKAKTSKRYSDRPDLTALRTYFAALEAVAAAWPAVGHPVSPTTMGRASSVRVESKRNNAARTAAIWAASMLGYVMPSAVWVVSRSAYCNGMDCGLSLVTSKFGAWVACDHTLCIRTFPFDGRHPPCSRSFVLSGTPSPLSRLFSLEAQAAPRENTHGAGPSCFPERCAQVQCQQQTQVPLVGTCHNRLGSWAMTTKRQPGQTRRHAQCRVEGAAPTITG